MVSRRRPVAIGSSVPQWPIFLVPSCRRASTTMSCDVIPSALSTRRMPSGEVGAFNGFTSFLQNFFFDFRQRSAYTRASSERVTAAAKLVANRADIHPFVFGTHADAHLSVGKFLEKHSDNDAVNCAEMID